MLSAVTSERDRQPDAHRASPPAPKRRETVHLLHGDSRIDAYAWMRDTDDPEVMAHFAAERSYYDAATLHLQSQVRTLSEEMTSRVPATDWSVSYRRVHFSYYTWTRSGSEYGQLCRRVYTPGAESHGESAPGHVLLDPAELKGDSPYVALGLTLVSPDERLVAYSVDTTGDEVYELRFRDAETGADLDDVVPRSSYGGAWSADSSTFFYTVHDHLYRAYQVWRHRLGTPADADRLVFEEPDERFEVDLRACRSGDVVVVTASSRDTSEVWLVDAHDPESPARCVEPRRRGVEYRCEHARTAAGDRLLIVTNDHAVEFRLMVASAGAARPRRLVRARDGGPGRAAARRDGVRRSCRHHASTRWQADGQGLPARRRRWPRPARPRHHSRHPGRQPGAGRERALRRAHHPGRRAVLHRAAGLVRRRPRHRGADPAVAARGSEL